MLWAGDERLLGGEMIPEFPKADFYDCRESEVLEWRTPEDAIAALYEWDGVDDLSDGCTVTCYRRRSIPSHFPERAAEFIVDWLSEHPLVEDLQNPEDEAGMFSPLSEEFRPRFAALVREMAERVEVWSCKSFAKVELSGEQTEEILRVACPELLEAAE